MTYTKQSLFDLVAAHLIKQGRKSVEHPHFPESDMLQGSCMYRSPDGLKCAAGALIADEHYSPALEFCIVGTEEVDEALRKSGVPHAMLGLVRALQFVHDKHPPCEWRGALSRCAGVYGLTFNAEAKQ